MAQLDLTPTVLRLLQAVERCNTPDFERALAKLRELTGYAEIVRLARQMRRAELDYRDAFNAGNEGAAYLCYAAAYDALTAALDAPTTEAPRPVPLAAIRDLLAAIDVIPGPYYNVRVLDLVNAAKALLALGEWVAAGGIDNGGEVRKK